MQYRNKTAHVQRDGSGARSDDLDGLMSRSVWSPDPLRVDMHNAGADVADAWTGIVGRPVQLVELPLLLTVGETAEVLNIKRTLAYRLTKLYPSSGGRDGIPVIALGGCHRVPCRPLLILAETGHVVNLHQLAVYERQLLRQVNGRRVTVPRLAGRATERLLVRARLARVRAVGLGGRPVGVGLGRSSSSGCFRPVEVVVSEILGSPRPIGFSRQVPVWAIGCRV